MYGVSGIIVDLIITLVLIVSIILGYKRGFLLSLYKVASFFVSIWLAWLFNPVVKVLLLKYTRLKVIINDKMEAAIMKMITDSIKLEAPEEQQEIVISKLNVPDILKKNLVEQFKNSDIENSIASTIADKLAEICINIIAFLIVLIVVLLILLLLKGVIKVISQIPVFEKINKVLGIVFGIVLCLIRVWAVFGVISLISDPTAPSIIVLSINDAFVGRFLYQNNFIVYIVLRMIM